MWPLYISHPHYCFHKSFVYCTSKTDTPGNFKSVDHLHTHSQIQLKCGQSFFYFRLLFTSLQQGPNQLR